MDKELLTIGEAAEFLGISVDTLRRWDKSGKLVAIKKKGGTHRYYAKEDLEMLSGDLLKLANKWAVLGGEIPQVFYCSNSAVFQTSLLKMQDSLISSGKASKIFSLIVATAGEIGNNSFDHNIGNWPDVPGIFFAFDVHKRHIVLADRGQGILATLKRVRSGLSNHTEALRVAFTEVLSGRDPEKRGNGLKFVRRIAREYPINLFFQTGDAILELREKKKGLYIRQDRKTIHGCLAVLYF